MLREPAGGNSGIRNFNLDREMVGGGDERRISQSLVWKGQLGRLCVALSAPGFSEICHVLCESFEKFLRFLRAYFVGALPGR